jgi:hypothetical protein
MYNLPEIDESAGWLDAQVRSEQDAQVQRRLQMLLLLKTGQAESGERREKTRTRCGPKSGLRAAYEWLNNRTVGKTRKRRKKTNNAVVSPEEGAH